MKKLSFFLLAITFSISQASADMIAWNYSATLNLMSGGTDFLNIDGSTISTTIFFDSTSTWSSGTNHPDTLYIKSIGAVSSISTGNEISLISPLPAAGFSENFGNRMYEDIDSWSYFDFIIDGYQFINSNVSGSVSTLTPPSSGDIITADSLSPSFAELINRFYTFNDIGTTYYETTNSKYSIYNVSTVPEPTSLTLLSLGMLGVIFIIRNKQPI